MVYFGYQDRSNLLIWKSSEEKWVSNNFNNFQRKHTLKLILSLFKARIRSLQRPLWQSCFKKPLIFQKNRSQVITYISMCSNILRFKLKVNKNSLRDVEATNLFKSNRRVSKKNVTSRTLMAGTNCYSKKWNVLRYFFKICRKFRRK